MHARLLEDVHDHVGLDVVRCLEDSPHWMFPEGSFRCRHGRNELNRPSR